MWVTIPLPSVCNTDALPIELIPIILVALVGNDPTLFTMSRWRFPIKLQSNMYRTRGSNSLNQPYEGRPFSAKLRYLFEHQEGFEPPSLRFAGVCLKPLDHWCIYFLSLWQGLNLRPIDYKSIALPAELQRHLFRANGGTRTHISPLQEACNSRYTTSAFL
jgi:hypothetical protein